MINTDNTVALWHSGELGNFGIFKIRRINEAKIFYTLIFVNFSLSTICK